MPVAYAGISSISFESGYEIKTSFVELSDDSHTSNKGGNSTSNFNFCQFKPLSKQIN